MLLLHDRPGEPLSVLSELCSLICSAIQCDFFRVWFQRVSLPLGPVTVLPLMPGSVLYPEACLCQAHVRRVQFTCMS